MPTVSQLMNGAAGVASLLGLRLPPINCGALAARYAAELGLPEVRPAPSSPLLAVLEYPKRQAPSWRDKGSQLWTCCSTDNLKEYQCPLGRSDNGNPKHEKP